MSSCKWLGTRSELCTIPDLERKSVPKAGKRLNRKHESHLRTTCHWDMWAQRCHMLRFFYEQLLRGLYRAPVFITQSVHYHNYNIISTGVRPLMLKNSCLRTDTLLLALDHWSVLGKNQDWNLFTVKCVGRSMLSCPVGDFWKQTICLLIVFPPNLL